MIWMKRTGAIAAGIVALMAMGTTSSMAQENGLSIDDIHWPYIDSYCTFVKEGQQFVFDDLETWRFVAFSNFPEVAESDPLERIFMRIDGGLRQLDLEKLTPGDGGNETRLYRSHDTLAYEVTIELNAGEKGYESTPYEGTITVKRADLEASVRFSGDCGV